MGKRARGEKKTGKEYSHNNEKKKGAKRDSKHFPK